MEGSPNWQLYYNETYQNFDSIYALATYLKNMH
jgi:hypothetical protein